MTEKTDIVRLGLFIAPAVPQRLDSLVESHVGPKLVLEQRPANPGPRAKFGPRTSFNWPAWARFQH